MPRARDKLNEAKFFLDKVEQTEGARTPEFRYYCSALFTAARSIGLVLQKDYRHEFGEDFDNWWEVGKATISIGTMPFETIREIRNVVLKLGNYLPGWLFEGKIDEGPVNRIVYLYDPSQDSEPLKSVSFRKPPMFDLVDEDKKTTEMRAEEEDAGLSLMHGMDIIFNRVKVVPDEYTYLGLSIDHGYVPMSFDELVVGMGQHLIEMESLVDEAELKFPRTPDVFR
jgi:hypothetical protein